MGVFGSIWECLGEFEWILGGFESIWECFRVFQSILEHFGGFRRVEYGNV